MYCKNCGVQIDDNAAFCPNCGTSITVSSGIGEYGQPQGMQPQTPPEAPYQQPSQPQAQPPYQAQPQYRSQYQSQYQTPPQPQAYQNDFFGGGTPQQGKGKKKSKKWILIVLIILAVLLAAAVVIGVLFDKEDNSEPDHVNYFSWAMIDVINYERQTSDEGYTAYSFENLTWIEKQYNGDGYLTEMRCFDLTTGEEQYIYTCSYDEENRLIEEKLTYESGSSAGDYTIASYEYNEDSRRVSQVQTEECENSVSDYDTYYYTYLDSGKTVNVSEYDDADTEELSSILEYSEEGLVTEARDASAEITVEYDISSNILSLNAYATEAGNELNRTYTYDNGMQIGSEYTATEYGLSITNENEYDENGRCIASAQTYSYTGVGEISTTINVDIEYYDSGILKTINVEYSGAYLTFNFDENGDLIG